MYDTLGKEIATLVNERKERGRYTVEFNAGDLPSGMYIYRITAGKYRASGKMILIKFKVQSSKFKGKRSKEKRRRKDRLTAGGG